MSKPQFTNSLHEGEGISRSLPEISFLLLRDVKKKLGSGCEKSSAHLQPAQAGHARLVLNKTVTFYAQPCSTLPTVP